MLEARDSIYLRQVTSGISLDKPHGLLGCVIPLLIADGIVDGLQRGLVA